MQNDNKQDHTKKNRGLRNRVILLLSTFLVVIISFNAYVLIQNSNTLEVSGVVSKVSMPLVAYSQDLLSAINRVSTIQRGYFMNRDANQIALSNEIWEDVIFANLDSIKKRENQLLEVEKQYLDTLTRLLPRYKEIQDRLYDIASKGDELDAGNVNLATADSSSAAEVLNQLLMEERKEEQIVNVLNTEVKSVREGIMNVIDPLYESQLESANTEIANVQQSIRQTNSYLLVISVIGVLLSGLLAYVLLKKLNQSVKRPADLLDQLSNGKLPDEIAESDDELNTVIVAGNRLSNNLKKASKFAQDIGEGSFETPFEPASEYDMLGNSLIQMRDKLSNVAEEDRKRNWTTTGLAEIGDILRKNYDNSEELYLDVVRFVVKYTGANQGGLFILDEQEEKYLNLAACFAYDRQKFLEKKIEIGQSLVGQAYLEKEMIYLKSIPDNYINITSGLGEATPHCLLIMPLMVNEEISGILEIASFHEFEEYQIDFIRKLSESVASTITSVKVSTRTAQLLEEAQQNEEEMKAQEEEMRQNNEELQATQEEMQRRQMELQRKDEQFTEITSELPGVLFQMLLDESGNMRFIYVSQGSTKLLGTSPESALKAVRIEDVITVHQEDSASFESDVAVSASETSSLNWEGRVADNNGNYKWIHMVGRPKHSAELDGTVWTGYITDIDERKEIERSLEAQQAEQQENFEKMAHTNEELNRENTKLTKMKKELEGKLQEAKQREQELIAKLDELDGKLKATGSKGTKSGSTTTSGTPKK